MRFLVYYVYKMLTFGQTYLNPNHILILKITGTCQQSCCFGNHHLCRLGVNFVQSSSYEDVLENSTEQDEGGSSQLLCLLSLFFTVIYYKIKPTHDLFHTRILPSQESVFRSRTVVRQKTKAVKTLIGVDSREFILEL